jgi:hypothetical protein
MRQEREATELVSLNSIARLRDKAIDALFRRGHFRDALCYSEKIVGNYEPDGVISFCLFDVLFCYYRLLVFI